MSESQKSSRKKKIVIGVISGIIILILAGIVWLKFFNSTDIPFIDSEQPINQLITQEKIDFDTTIFDNSDFNNLKQFGPYPLTVKKVGNKNLFSSS